MRKPIGFYKRNEKTRPITKRFSPMAVGIIDDRNLYQLGIVALDNLIQPYPVRKDCNHKWENTGKWTAIGILFKCEHCKSTTLNPSAYGGRRIWSS